MIQDIEPRRMDNSYKNILPEAEDSVLVFDGHGRKDDRILYKITEDGFSYPLVRELPEADYIYLFSIDTQKFFLLEERPDSLPEGYEFHRLDSLRRNQPGDLCFAGMTGYHLFAWYRDSHFCGRCGKQTVHDTKERMMRCQCCGNMIFPKIAPAVIIGLRNGESILMSRYAGRAYKGRALLAGFCEIGETPEETVAREVMEEVGLKVKNVTYYSSQPWGFDSNLLLGYFADVDGDTEITLDEEELASAGFEKRDEIEEDPNLLSLTATMIEAFRTGKD